MPEIILFSLTLDCMMAYLSGYFACFEFKLFLLIGFLFNISQTYITWIFVLLLSHPCGIRRYSTTSFPSKRKLLPSLLSQFFPMNNMWTISLFVITQFPDSQCILLSPIKPLKYGFLSLCSPGSRPSPLFRHFCIYYFWININLMIWSHKTLTVIQ